MDTLKKVNNKCLNCGKETNNSAFCDNCKGKFDKQINPEKDANDNFYNFLMISIFILILICISWLLLKDKINLKENNNQHPVYQEIKKEFDNVNKQNFNVKNPNYNVRKREPLRSTLKEEPEPDFGPYMRELQRRIKRNWDPPRAVGSKRVIVIFKVSRDGRLLVVRIKRSSGIAEVDRAAKAAIELTAPFSPLPPEFKGNDIDIQFTFDYNAYNRH